LWVAGHSVYGTCVIVANVVILHKFHIHTFLSMFFVAIGIILFFFAMGFENYFPEFHGIYCWTGELFRQKIIWFSIVFVALQTTLFEQFFRTYFEYHEIIFGKPKMLTLKTETNEVLDSMSNFLIKMVEQEKKKNL